MGYLAKYLVSFFGAGAIVFVVVLLFMLGPMLTLWALNTLSENAHFGWYIPHNVWTYLAIFVLCGIFNTNKTTTMEKK
jgi:hypothetical protein